ncbi:unnamed protein product [Nyctereutes procyonoides]|uniref:(raccoon dog) hypothetical protein n=1 Tax=Nyctereutes procyonoides TaxID=34880 RepID=A0A811YVT3_NYCPR|nr:unnamed protein product [Nyctereutes procyonoides]CAD7688201.1 unnamed protein product [Nyctereutes procyonoides]
MVALVSAPGVTVGTAIITRPFTLRCVRLCYGGVGGGRQYDGILCEFHTYADSALVGFRSAKFGGRVNEVFHVWKCLIKNKECPEQFLIPNLALLANQEFEITYVVPLSKTEKPPKESMNCVDSRVAGRHQFHENLRLMVAVWENVNYEVLQQKILRIPMSPHR